MNTIRFDSQKTLVVGHRGVSGLECENTCASFVAAGNRSYYGIETDVHYTADGQYVIIHDDHTGRVADRDLRVEETDMATLRTLKMMDIIGYGRGDLQLPTLQEYVRICKKYEKVGVLELKSDFSDAQIAEITDIIREIGWLDHIIFIAFGIENLYKLRKILPEQPAQFLCCEWTDGLLPNLVKHNLDLDIHFEALTAERIRAAHDAGVRVNCWTVDGKADAERLAAWGVDYITSNILEGK